MRATLVRAKCPSIISGLTQKIPNSIANNNKFVALHTEFMRWGTRSQAGVSSTEKKH